MRTLYQLHWQNRENLDQTEMVAQCDLPPHEVAQHFMEIAMRRKDECPEGWVPMICNEESKYFVRAAADDARKEDEKPVTEVSW